MPDRNWLNELAQELADRKLPPAYAARLVEELSDHVTDLLEDHMSTDALESHKVFRRLGAPHDVASQAVAEYRKRSFCGRHPVLMFVMLPAITMAMLLYVELMGLAGIGMALKSAGAEWSSERFSPLTVGGMRLACILAIVLPAMFTASGFAWLAARAGVSRKWPLVAAVALGLLAAAAHLDVFLSPNAGQSKLTLGVGVSSALLPTFFQLSRFAVPVLVGMWIFTRRARLASPTLAR